MSRAGTTGKGLTRREWLAAAGALAFPARARSAPASPVAVAACRSYGSEMEPVLRKLFDQAGGLGRFVRGKTVVIKVNMTGNPSQRFRHFDAGDSFWTHPAMIGRVIHLMGLAGARRIRIVESFASGSLPLAESMLMAGWDPADFLNAAPNVELHNTSLIGEAKKYSRLPAGGDYYIYPGFDLNYCYEECDVFVSISKLKEHATAGVTMCLKNLFGIAPTTIYGGGAGVDEPAITPNGGRSMFHTGYRQPSKSAPQEREPLVTADPGARVPLIVVDLAAARPIDLAIIDGIWTITGAEGPWNRESRRRRMRRIEPGVLAVGANAVCTDAVGTALMGFDPMAGRGSAPFETCDNTLELAEDRGLGSRDLNRIEVIGPKLSELAMDFRNPA